MTAHWLGQGRRLVGAKIGLTNKAVQSVFGVFQPDFGVLLADMAVPDGDIVDLKRLIQPRVEAEVAFVLGTDLPHQDITSVDVIRATDYLLPAIEIVDSRIKGWDISIVDTVGGQRLVGPLRARYDSHTTVQSGSATVRDGAGAPRRAGIGGCGRGVPRQPAQRRDMARLDGGAHGVAVAGGRRRAVRRFGPMVPVTPGAMYEARISGMGSVRVGFSGSGE
jgi:2-keto-4-pentenoate hydratase